MTALFKNLRIFYSLSKLDYQITQFDKTNKFYKHIIFENTAKLSLSVGDIH